MAKAGKKKHDTGSTITTPSWFGSHESMLVALPYNFANIPDDMCVCEDDNGEYLTYKDRLDNGLADPKRYSRSINVI